MEQNHLEEIVDRFKKNVLIGDIPPNFDTPDPNFDVNVGSLGEIYFYNREKIDTYGHVLSKILSSSTNISQRVYDISQWYMGLVEDQIAIVTILSKYYPDKGGLEFDGQPVFFNEDFGYFVDKLIHYRTRVENKFNDDSGTKMPVPFAPTLSQVDEDPERYKQMMVDAYNYVLSNEERVKGNGLMPERDRQAVADYLDKIEFVLGLRKALTTVGHILDDYLSEGEVSKLKGLWWELLPYDFAA